MRSDNLFFIIIDKLYATYLVMKLASLFFCTLWLIRTNTGRLVSNDSIWVYVFDLNADYGYIGGIEKITSKLDTYFGVIVSLSDAIYVFLLSKMCT